MGKVKCGASRLTRRDICGYKEIFADSVLRSMYSTVQYSTACTALRRIGNTCARVNVDDMERAIEPVRATLKMSGPAVYEPRNWAPAVIQAVFVHSSRIHPSPLPLFAQAHPQTPPRHPHVIT